MKWTMLWLRKKQECHPVCRWFILLISSLIFLTAYALAICSFIGYLSRSYVIIGLFVGSTSLIGFLLVYLSVDYKIGRKIADKLEKESELVLIESNSPRFFEQSQNRPENSNSRVAVDMNEIYELQRLRQIRIEQLPAASRSPTSCNTYHSVPLHRPKSEQRSRETTM